MKTPRYLACAIAKAFALLFVTSSALVPLSSAGATYYVNSASPGSDSNDGLSTAHPWQTLAKVNAKTFSAGDTIAFARGGSWSETTILNLTGVATSTGAIRATAYNISTGALGDEATDKNDNVGTDDRPKISAGTADVAYAVKMQNSGYWTIEDLDISGGEQAGLLVAAQNNPANTVFPNVTIRKLRVHDTWYKIHIDPVTPANDYYWFGHGIYVYFQGKTTQIFDHLTIDSCDIYNTLRRGISVESTQSISYTDPTNANGGQSADPARYGTNLKITNNLIHDTRVDGIYVGGCANFYVAWNTIFNAGSLNDFANTHFGRTDHTWPDDDKEHKENFNGMFWCGSLGFTGVALGASTPARNGDGCQVHHNTVYNTATSYWTTSSGYTDNMAFDLDLNNAGLHIVEYNETHGNADGFMETLHDSLDDQLTGVTGLTDQLIVRYNISYDDNLHETAANLNYSMLLCLIGKHQTFYNNTFYCGSSPGTAIVNRRDWGGPWPWADGLFENNIFYCPNGFHSSKQTSESASPFTYTNNAIFGDISNLVNYTNVMANNPVFRNPGSLTAVNLQLMTTSPCVRYGIGVSGISPQPNPQVDFFELPFYLGTTLGADALEDLVNLPFDNSASDISGHANNATLSGTGTSYSSSSHAGSACLYLNGSGYATVPTSTSTAYITDQIGIDLWVNPDSQTTGTYRRLIDRATSGSTDGVVLDLTPTNQLRFIVRGDLITTTTTLTAGTWYHVEATYAQNGTMHVYLNGTDIGNMSSGSNPPFDPANTHPFRIGADQTGGQRLPGYLDDVKIRSDSIQR